MAMKRIAGVLVISLDETDQNIRELNYAAGEVLKIDVSGTDLTGLVMTLAPTASGDPVAEFEPASIDAEGVAQFRIPDAELAPWIEEGETNFVNLWTGDDSDPRRRAFGTVKRKVSIKRGVVSTITVFEPDIYEVGVFV